VRPHWRAQLGVAGAIARLVIVVAHDPPFQYARLANRGGPNPHAEIEGDRVVIHNFRHFDNITKTDFRPQWKPRPCIFPNLRCRFFTNYWGSTLICHTFLSFDFGPEDYVCKLPA
jgi:hypothetical protein